MRCALLALLLVVGACGGDDDGTVTTDPGPNPTAADPGPNDTSSGPTTLQGSLVLDPATGCIALDTESAEPVALAFRDYELGDDGRPALVASADDRVLAHAGDTIVVTGEPGDAPADACGTPFAVESLNSVIPAS